MNITPEFSTADICDANEDKLANGSLTVVPPVFSCFGRRMKFAGPVYTLKVFEDNALVRTTLEAKGNGQVLVIDGGGSVRCALVGGKLGVLAEENGWAGIVVNGCIRDVEEINVREIGVRALATHPQRSIRKGFGDVNLRVSIAGVAINPGDWIYADADGVVVARERLLS